MAGRGPRQAPGPGIGSRPCPLNTF